MRKLCFVVSVLAVMLAGLPQAYSAPEARPADLIERIVLKNFTGSDMLRLLTSEVPDPPKPGEESGLRSPASLVPMGVRSLIGSPKERALVALGTPEAVRLVRAGARVADVRVEPAENGEVRVAVEPAAALIPEISAAALKLPDAGIATPEGKRLVFVGKPLWAYTAVRATARLEMAALSMRPTTQP